MIKFDGSDVISWRPTDSDINMEMTEEDIFDETAKPYDRTLKMTAEVDTAVDTEPEPEPEPYQTLIALTPANSRKKTKTPRLVLEDTDRLIWYYQVPIFERRGEEEEMKGDQKSEYQRHWLQEIQFNLEIMIWAHNIVSIQVLDFY